MKKLLFIFIALCGFSAMIYASFPVTETSFPVTENKTELVEMTQPVEAPASEPDWPLFIVCLFVGGLGIHRFMMGDITNGILMLITAGGCGIWTLIDLINIATGKLSR